MYKEFWEDLKANPLAAIGEMVAIAFVYFMVFVVVCAVFYGRGR